MVSSRNKMILASGRFMGTDRAQLTEAFDAYMADGATKPLVIHFHGGLVTEQHAEQIADTLAKRYREAGGYPFFVIWQAGLLEQLRNNWKELVLEDVFPALVERVLQFVVGKLDQAPGEKGDAVSMPTRFAVRDEIAQKQAAGAVPFADRDADAARIDPELTPAEEAQLTELVEKDPFLTAAAMTLTREDAPDLNSVLQGELDAANAEKDPDTKGLLSTALLVRSVFRIGQASLSRFASGRHHGVYTTVVEEVARELKGDRLAGIVWKHLKKDNKDSFDGPSDTHGGTALLEEIARVHVAGHRPRIVLVGHSTGGVYISYLLLKAAEMLPPEVKFDVVFLAPACTFELLGAALDKAGDRVRWFRSFAMKDDLERQDAIFPPIYMYSLLYLVSALAEDAVDMPLVGMERYHSGVAPFHAEPFPEIQQVLTAFGGFTDPWIWSVNDTGSGLNSLSRKHGDFDSEEQTLVSVAHLITHGVS